MDIKNLKIKSLPESSVSFPLKIVFSKKIPLGAQVKI
jgi:hypothetical protein